MRVRMLCRKAQVSYEEYLEALGTSTNGYSVVLKRDLDEIYINPYNREWMKAWNANMDLQVVLDFFAVITYVTDYYAKDDTGKWEVIKQMLKESKGDSLQEKMNPKWVVVHTPLQRQTRPRDGQEMCPELSRLGMRDREEMRDR